MLTHGDCNSPVHSAPWNWGSLFPVIIYCPLHRRSQGVHVHPPGQRKKFLLAKFTGKSCKCRACTPRQSRSPFFTKLGRSGRWERLFR